MTNVFKIGDRNQWGFCDSVPGVTPYVVPKVTLKDGTANNLIVIQDDSGTQDVSYLGKTQLLTNVLLRARSTGNTWRALDVAGTTADAVATGAAVLPTLATLQAYNGATFDRLRTPKVFKTGSFTVAGNTAIWTPAAGKKFRLMRFRVQIGGNTTFLTTAGPVTVRFSDAATATGIFTQVTQIPIAAVSGQLSDSGWIDLGNGFLSALANNALNVNLTLGGVGTFSNGVHVSVCGTEE